MRNPVNAKEKEYAQENESTFKFAISTSWNAFRVSEARDLLSEIKNIGFLDIELSFNLPYSFVEDIKRLIYKSEITVVSLHNFCPIPKELTPRVVLPDHFSLASLDQNERDKAIRYTKETIDTASELGAKAVVLHIGRVEVPERTKDLIFLYKHRLNKSIFFRLLREKAIKERRAHAEKHIYNCLKSLEVLNRYAQEKDIFLGIENRYFYREIPSFEELKVIFSNFDNSNIFYWHDTGHAQVMENLGFFKHKDLLDAYGNKMLGVHLHDVVGCSDHRAPGFGEFDFSLLRPYLRKDTLKVIEAHYPATAEQLLKSKVYLKEILNGRF